MQKGRQLLRIRNFIRCIFFIAFLHSILQEGRAQSLGNIMPNYQSTFSVAASYGGTFKADAWLWGFAADYSTFISNKWIGSASIAYDQETAQLGGGRSELANTVSLQFAAGYMINRRLSFGAGFAKGTLGNIQGQGNMKFKDFGKDWTVGILGIYTFWMKGPHSLDVSSSLEYRLNETKGSYSFDIGYGYSF